VILLWGLPKDGPVAAVAAELANTSLPVVLLDQRATLDTELQVRFVGDGIAGAIDMAGTTIDLDSVTSCLMRPYDSLGLAAIERAGPASVEWRHAQSLERGLWLWAEYAPGLVVNRPSAMLRCSSKPCQSTMIRDAGFEYPETLITTDPEAAQEFLSRHGSVVYKSISSIRSIVARVTVAHQERLGDIQWCPTQFQEYIQGLDHRVHVVGDEIFSCTIESEAVDYRYASREGAAVEIRSVNLPDDCIERCRTLTACMGLTVAGIDLRRTPDGAWYCFEVNPSPAFTFFECDPEDAIATAMARLLTGGGGN